MKKYLFSLLLTGCTGTILAQNPAISSTDSGSFFLHKFAQNIGKETFRVATNGTNTMYDISFRFVDRGTPVPLRAQLITGPGIEPVSLFIKGNTSRFSAINDTIKVSNKQADIRVDDSVYRQALPLNAFPVGGYSPGTVQMLLLQYWKQKNTNPKIFPCCPQAKCRS